MKKQIKAFTLVELIVVITILAILGTIAFISFEGYSKNARDSVRVSDLNNIRKNLEIFITEKGFYPNPDNGINITYIGATAWTQGTVGDNVITNLSRINKKPTDPLTGNEYTYSITNAKTEYQLGAIDEGGLLSFNSSSLISTTNAATEKRATAIVVGTYNEKILKVSTGSIDYILAVPSIINSDITDSNLQSIIDNRKLVYNNYSNLPDSYKNLGYTMTGGFDFVPTGNNIVVYSGSLATLSSSGTVQQDFISNLQTVYDGTIIQSEPTINEIITATTPTQKQLLVGNYIDNHIGGITGTNTVVTEIETESQTYSCTGSLVTANADITNTGGLTVDTDYQKLDLNGLCYYQCINGYTGDDCETPIPTFLSNCTDNGQIYYTDSIGIKLASVTNAGVATWVSGKDLRDLTCTGHIIVCNGNNAGYILQACNLGSSTVGATNNSAAYGNYYQWGNNGGTPSGSKTPSITPVNTITPITYGPGNYYNSTIFIGGASLTDWSSPQNNNLWGSGGTVVQRQGPCSINYHIPTSSEWYNIYITGGWGYNGANLSNTLKMPYVGYRNIYGTMDVQGDHGVYWSSSPSSITANAFYFYSGDIMYGYANYRTYGFSVRCFKN